MRRVLLCATVVYLAATFVRADDALRIPHSSALAAYVAKEDKSYAWVKRRGGDLGKGSYVELTLTSQTWHDIVWRHQLFIYRPSQMAASSQAIFLIEGGRWSDSLAKPPVESDSKLPGAAYLIAAAAEQIQAPVAVLLQVPQQPIFGGMTEDEIISHTFVKFLETGNADWPLLLPMVKSAVRGMDAVQAFAHKEWSLDIEHFTVTGASKRGWTTWLTAAVDLRVNALAPMVIDMLNMGPQMKHQVASFGDFSERIHDYTEKGLQKQLSTKAGADLQAIVDPYSYRRQLTQPKLIMLGTNDRYWPVDALNVYWDGLEGEKYILYVPNNGHGLRDYGRMFGTLAALHRKAAAGKPMAKPSWTYVNAPGENGPGRLTLRVKSDVQPKEVQIWTATSATKDFRDSTWHSAPATQEGDAYTHQLAVPNGSFAAVFGEAVYDGEGLPYYLSTTMQVVGSAKPAAKPAVARPEPVGVGGG